MKKLLLILFLSGIIIYGQPKDVKDTLTVVTAQRFKVPASNDIVLSNIKSVKISAELLDANSNVIRTVNDFVQIPSATNMQQALKGKRSVLVTYSCFETIDEPGTYYIKVKIDAVSETGPQKGERVSKIVVVNPILAAPMNLRETYFYSEKETFSFATLEYTDFNRYSYTIYNDKTNAVLDTGRGPIVVLDKIFSDINMVDSKFRIVGKYNNKEFMYKLKDGTVKATTWYTTLNKLSLNPLVLLTEEAEFKKTNERLIVSAYNPKILILQFGYFAKTASGNFATALPIIKSLNVSSDPPQYLQTAVPSTPTTGAFSTVRLVPNQSYIDEIEEYGTRDITVKVSFETQFKEKFNFTYYFQILK